jgi:hypothetical protein
MKFAEIFGNCLTDRYRGAAEPVSCAEAAIDRQNILTRRIDFVTLVVVLILRPRFLPG